MLLRAVESNLPDTPTNYCNIERVKGVNNRQSDLRIPTHISTLLASLKRVNQDKISLMINPGLSDLRRTVRHNRSHIGVSFPPNQLLDNVRQRLHDLVGSRHH